MKSRNFGGGIHIAVKKGGKFLILKKSASDKDDAGRWDLPGGGIEFGEQPFEAAIRETQEEAGIKVAITKILTTWAMPYEEKWSIEFLVEGKWLGGNIKLSPEHSEYQWVSRQELKTIKPKGLFTRKLADLI
ncbi:MAG: NUDIX domain-containing protein [Patescibacteria group bacterium]